VKIQDAKPGDIMQDCDGDTWVVDHQGLAWCVLDCLAVGGDISWRRADAEQFGPFVRLVHEEASEW
jgi:hypothetical protein